MTERICPTCGAPLQRRRQESTFKWTARKFCNKKCSAVGRIKVTRKKFGESILWDPIIYDPPPASDQCWAGFLTGRRCVLPRGAHVTHRDVDGCEFVRANPPSAPVERNTGATAMEMVSFRNERRPRLSSG